MDNFNDLPINKANAGIEYVIGMDSIDGRVRIPVSHLAGGVINVRSHGALGDNLTDDTAAINDAITALPTNGVLYFPTGIYVVTEPLKTLSKAGTHILGDGIFASRIKFAPTADGTMLTFSAGGSQLSGGSVQNIMLFCQEAETTKVALYLEDVGSFVVRNVLISNFTGTDSEGLRIAGRDDNRFDHLSIAADVPLHIMANPNVANGGLSLDMATFTQVYLRCQGSNSALPNAGIVIDDVTQITNVSFAGNLSITGALFGIHWTHNTAVVASYDIHIENYRPEQMATGTAYGIYIDGNNESLLQTVSVDRMFCGATCDVGIYARGVQDMIVNGLRGSNATFVAFDLDDVDLLDYRNLYGPSTGMTFNMNSYLEQVSASPYNRSQNSDLPHAAVYQKLQPTHQQIPGLDRGVKEWAWAGTLADDGQTQIPLNTTEGVTSCMLFASAADATTGVMEAGMWVLSLYANGAKGVALVAGTANCVAINTDTKFFAYANGAAELVAPVYVRNRLGGPADVVIKAYYM